jgi:hypothetical protein
VTLARGPGRLWFAGSGRAQLVFTPAARSLLAAARAVRLTIVGYAVGPGGATGAPRSATVALRG